jgi:hypothetical protein
MKKQRALKKRGIIGIYKMLLKKNTVQQSGPAYKRMRELEREYIKETRWLSGRLKDDESISFGWLKEDLN